MPLDDQDEQFIRSLIEEAGALPRAEMPPSKPLMGWGAPVAGMERKTPEQYDQDQRRKYVLDKLNERYGDNPAYLPVNLQAPLVKYRSGEMDLGSDYQSTGMTRHPLWTGLQWFASMPATAYNASKVLGNQITPGMYPDAEKNLAKAANTLTFGVAEDLGAVPRGTGNYGDDFNAELDERGRVPWFMLDPQGEYEQIGAERQAKADQAIPAGWQHLESMGVPPTAAMVWGGVMDTMLDPFTQTAKTLKLARQGGPAMAAFIGDHAMGLGLPAALSAPAAARSAYGTAQDLLDRLRDEPGAR